MKKRYRSRPTRRRSPAEMGEFLSAIQDILDGEEYAITVRHLFYRLVALGVIAKTEKEYRGLVHHLSKWRRDGEVPWDAFADSTRWHIRSQTFDGITDALQRCKETTASTKASCVPNVNVVPSLRWTESISWSAISRTSSFGSSRGARRLAAMCAAYPRAISRVSCATLAAVWFPLILTHV
jgi:hypothetical protein